jgi:hypothetical protein
MCCPSPAAGARLQSMPPRCCSLCLQFEISRPLFRGHHIPQRRPLARQWQHLLTIPAANVAWCAAVRELVGLIPALPRLQRLELHGLAHPDQAQLEEQWRGAKGNAYCYAGVGGCEEWADGGGGGGYAGSFRLSTTPL